MAGDVNGDGHPDLIVNADGRPYVYYGTSTGFGDRPSWLASDSSYAGLGTPLPIGDVNGDGFDDIAIARSAYDSGRVLIYYGSTEGLRSSSLVGNVPSARPEDASWIWNFSDYNLRMAAPAGDVNADGFSDFMVSRGNAFSQEQEVAVFHGSAIGLG